MGLESDTRRNNFRRLRQSILQSYIDAIRAERGGISNPLVAAQVLIDFQDLDVPLVPNVTPSIPETIDIDLPAEYKGFRHLPAIHRFESDYHPNPLDLTPMEQSAMARLIRAHGAPVPTFSFINPQAEESPSEDSVRVMIRGLRLKLNDHLITVDGKKTRRFIQNVLKVGYKLEPVEFKPS